MSRTLTRADLAESIYRQVGLPRKLAQDLVDQLFDFIIEKLVQGEEVKVSSFGNFAVRAKRQRIGRNPKTGVEVPITPRRVMVFKASHVLKDLINAGQA